jgi:uncharacterized protein YjbI with pentapeptide repeats
VLAQGQQSGYDHSCCATHRYSPCESAWFCGGLGERMAQLNYFLIRLLANQDSTLQSRWRTQPEWIERQEQIRTALGRGGELPTDLPIIKAQFGDGTIKMADLRGIDLSNLAIGAADLAYCCFDGANFSATRFDSTYLQYASMNDASLHCSNWNQVQASPISACRSAFTGAHIHDSFFMRSNLENANFANATITGTALSGSLLGAGNLTNAATLRNVDISDLLLATKGVGKAVGIQLASRDGVVGIPNYPEV